MTEADRVGFDRPGPTPSAAHELTDASLPAADPPRGPGPRGDAGHVGQETPAAARGNGRQDDTWRSANDDRWQQASALRKPKAGGVTSWDCRRVPSMV
ncbi:Signal transduction histidine-protein kinase/phosphatase MprB OS=Streptomyces antimycoticus OX=68175 GN=SSPO_034480 PE=4 SV=1 [Streptomyces antimycoticus]